MPQIDERPRWQMWAALVSGMAVGYAGLMGFVFAFG